LPAIVNGSYVEQSLLLTNTGTTTAPLIASAAAPFSITAPSNSFTLNPGQSQPVTVRFSSSASGSFTGAAVVTSGTSSASIPLTAASHALSLEFTPAQVDFGETFVGNGDGIVRTISVKNNTPVLLTLTPSPNDSFSAISPNGPFTLSPSQSREVTIRFKPTESGVFSPHFLFYANNGGTASSAGLTLSGIAHKIKISPSPVEFFRFRDSTLESQQPVTIVNEGNTTVSLKIALSTIPGDTDPVLPFDISAPLPSATYTFTLTPTQSREIILRFAPATSGIFRGNLNVMVQSLTDSVSVLVTGRALTYQEYLDSLTKVHNAAVEHGQYDAMYTHNRDQTKAIVFSGFPQLSADDVVSYFDRFDQISAPEPPITQENVSPNILQAAQILGAIDQAQLQEWLWSLVLA
jgi:hypothetical protein